MKQHRLNRLYDTAYTFLVIIGTITILLIIISRLIIALDSEGRSENNDPSHVPDQPYSCGAYFCN